MINEKELEVGSDFSGIGAFDQALIKLNINYKTIFACDMDKYSRKSYIQNYGEPDYFPENVYNRNIPEKPLDIYMTSPPCQAFSLAGSRKGEDDKRGVLFYNSHKFIQKNNPRYFIFENVKGLLSDDKGRTFQKWVDLLGGKSVNGNPVLFAHYNSVPYHIYFKVLNAKHYGIPQNRERIFIVGIRDDSDNTFRWPKQKPLEKRLKHILETDVDEKYYLSDKLLEYFNNHKKLHKEKGNGFAFKPKEYESIANSISTKSGSRQTDNYIYDKIIKKGFIKQDTQGSQVYNPIGISPTISSGTHGYANGYVAIGAIIGRNPENPKSIKSGLETEQMLEINENGTSNTLTTVYKDNVVVYGNLRGGKWDKTHEQSRRVYDPKGVSAALHTMSGGNQHHKIIEGYRIRKLTPLECFRLMGFPDEFLKVCSDTQLYKQCGNSIVVDVLESIISRLKL